LNRDVALKVISDTFALDPDRLARFRREAQVLASLNHPHIAAIHGFEDSGDTHALVLELVEGETLADRIARGAIPLDEALSIARQIAEALEAAHDQGIIHRDLKPANIKITPDGNVKVLDFGLAKLTEGGGPGRAGELHLTQSPTITSPAQMTGVGVILGTAAYMAPEQAKGQAADKRADVWAFGAVVFEMLTGLRPFTGETIPDTLASVLKTEPNWRMLPVATPTAVRRLLRRCLEKDRKRRLDSAADAWLEIEEALTAPSAIDNGAAQAGAAPRSAWAGALPWAVAGALAAGLAAVLVLWAPWRPPSPPHVTRTTITTASPVSLTINGTDRTVAVSPDGTHVVYIGNNDTQLFVRALNALEPLPIASGVALRGPFISPDGEWVGFLSSNTLRKVAITGGPPITLARLDGVARGATWAPDDTIIFATVSLATGLQRVSAAGGTPETLTRPDQAQGEADHLWPEILPGGRAVLFTITGPGGLETAQVAVRDLRTGTHKVLVRGGSHGHYVASGHLVYVAAGTLRAIAFDPARLEVQGTAVPVLSQLVTTESGAGNFAVAADGTLVYVDAPGSFAANARTVVWVDRTGKEEPVIATPQAYDHPRLSPDGTRVAFFRNDQERDLWIWDLRRATPTRLTIDAGQDWMPIWTADGQRIIFSSNRGGQFNLWWQAADGTGTAERLTTSTRAQFPTGITPHGTVLFFEARPPAGPDLLQLALDGTGQVTPLLETKFAKRNGIVSPDGRWLAYESNESNSAIEIYVRPFPNVGGGQWQVSTTGGTKPLWARNGKELFYVGADGTLMRVPVEASGASLNAGAPMKVLDRPYYSGGNAGRSYDVSPDGQMFLMITAPGADTRSRPTTLIVVQHWDEELKRLVPTK
jgi:serine/threonine-protein kinase